MSMGEFLGESREDGVKRGAGSEWRSVDRVAKFVWVQCGPVRETAESGPVDLQPSWFGVNGRGQLGDCRAIVARLRLDHQSTTGRREQTFEHRQCGITLLVLDARNRRCRSTGFGCQRATRKTCPDPSVSQQIGTSNHKG